MRVFDHPNMDGFRCPICGTSEDKPVVLIGVNGTEDGNIMEARQYHLDCIELVEHTLSSSKVIAMQFKEAIDE